MHPWQVDYVAQERIGERRDAVALAGFGANRFVALVRRAETTEGAEGALEAVEEKEGSPRVERL